MSFSLPSYANKTPIYLTYLNIDRMYTAVNQHTCSQLDYYQYIQYISDNEHALPL